MIYQNVLVQLLQKQLYPLMWNHHCLLVNQYLWILWVTPNQQLYILTNMLQRYELI